MRKFLISFFLSVILLAPARVSGTGRRFVDRGDGTVVDTVTGTMWVKDPDFVGTHCKKMPRDFPCRLLITLESAFLPWERAHNIVRLLSFAGYSDWRLPRKEEIAVLSRIQRGELDNPFGAFRAAYWTSTPGSGPNAHWMLFPQAGILASVKGDTLGFVWPVRTAATPESRRRQPGPGGSVPSSGTIDTGNGIPE